MFNFVRCTNVVYFLECTSGFIAKMGPLLIWEALIMHTPHYGAQCLVFSSVLCSFIRTASDAYFKSIGHTVYWVRQMHEAHHAKFIFFKYQI